MENPDQIRCAVADIARRKAITAAEDAGRPPPSESELAVIELEALRKDVFGFDYKTDRHGNPIQQGIGAPGRETTNHMQSIRRYEGEESYQRAVRRLWKENPARAKALNLPEPARVS